MTGITLDSSPNSTFLTWSIGNEAGSELQVRLAGDDALQTRDLMNENELFLHCFRAVKDSIFVAVRLV